MADNDGGQDVELSFSEAMLSDIAADVAKVRRNTSFLAGVLLLYVALGIVVPLVFLLFNAVD